MNKAISYCRLALPGMHLYEKTYRNLLGALGAEPSVWCECRFVNPVADIAVEAKF